MRLGHLQRRHIWTILGSTLILAAFIVLTCTSLHVRDLPATPWACDEYECDDPIYNLRTPYAITAGWALVTGTTGMLLMALGRPHRRRKFVRHPPRWRRALVNAVFVAGVAAGILLPWWALMDDIVAWSVPAVSLVIALGLTLVHLILWWWLRRQHGEDRSAWLTALTVQAFASILTAAISAPLFLVAALIAPPLQFVLVLLGAKIGAQPPDDVPVQPAAHDNTTASRPQLLLTTATIAIIAIGTAWAALPHPIPEDLQTRLESGDWLLRK